MSTNAPRAIFTTAPTARPMKIHRPPAAALVVARSTSAHAVPSGYGSSSTARTVSSATESALGAAALVDMCITSMQIVKREGNHAPQYPARGAEGHSQEGSPEAHQCEPSGNRAAAGTAGGAAERKGRAVSR